MTSPLISVPELVTWLAGPTPPVLLDVRYRLGAPPGRPAYERGHLPGAAYVDMDAELAGRPGPGGVGGRHPMPDQAVFGAAMRAAGVSAGRTVVCYDDWRSLPASRAWWLLRYFGHQRVTVLDGGLTAWTSAGGQLETGNRPRATGDFAPTPGSRTLIDAAGAAALQASGALIDGRPARRFAGRDETVDPVAGHIPGAWNVPALENVRRDGRLLPAEELRGHFEAAVAAAGTGGVGTYCGSGIQATHLALALAVTGLDDDPAVYIGSWSDWISDPTRPIDPGEG